MNVDSFRVPPHSVDSEQALLACCIQEGGQESITACIENKIMPESFFKPAHQIVFQALLDLYKKGTPVDEVILCEHLRSKREYDTVGGNAYINEIVDRIDTPAHLPHYLKRVKELYILRRLIRISTRTIEEAYSEQEDMEMFLEGVEQQIFKISEDRITDSAKPIKEPLEDAVNQINFMLQNRGQLTGIPSGFLDLDKMTSGFKPQEMIVVAARPSMGKTSLALNMAEAALMPKASKREPTPTLMFSLEMSAEQLAMRLLCSYTHVDMQKLKDGFLSQESHKELAKGANLLKDLPLWIDDSGSLSILEMRAKARRVQAQKSLGLVIIDYLQLISGTDSRVPREQQISEISRGVKAMAKELNVPVIVLSQLNRDSEKERRQPRLSDLRESGSIEQDADLVLLLSRQKDADDEKERGLSVLPRDLIVAKQRNGPVGIVPLVFNKRFTRFENYIDDQPV
ncbi:MAG: replicative DNA helicase [Verrucomicrobia bacterium CG1_02_43_26]|nr:MAG: replicative DNA helicase [Verrucomicrobia bacterium CG1_02_43_26]